MPTQYGLSRNPIMPMTLTTATRSLFLCLPLAMLLSACAPVQHQSTDATTADSGEDAQQAASQTAEPELLVFPTDVILECPEPAPPIEPVCPPQKVPKCPVCPAAKVDGKMVVGTVEKVSLDPPGVMYTARIDSGADGTSIHATDIVPFERDGKRWVRFTLDRPDADSEPITMEREVVRRVRIRQAELDEVERRLVVMLQLTLGSFSDSVEISLTDRSHMEYPVLIGRNILRNNAVVDVSQEMIAK